MARESLNSKITEKDRRDSDSEEQALVPDTGRYRQIQMLSQARLQKHLNLSVHHCQRQRVPALAASPLCPPTWIPLCKSSVVKNYCIPHFDGSRDGNSSSSGHKPFEKCLGSPDRNAEKGMKFQQVLITCDNRMPLTATERNLSSLGSRQAKIGLRISTRIATRLRRVKNVRLSSDERYLSNLGRSSTSASSSRVASETSRSPCCSALVTACAGTE